MIILSVGLIMTLVMVAGAAPTLAQLSPEDKAARKAAKQEQKAAKQQQKAAAKQQQKAAKQQQPLPPSGGLPVDTIALYTLGASALVVGGGLVLVGRTVTRL